MKKRIKTESIGFNKKDEITKNIQEKKLLQKECPKCHKKINVAKVSACSSCGWELFTPVISRKWTYKSVIYVNVIILIFYVLFLLFKPVLYSLLDKV